MADDDKIIMSWNLAAKPKAVYDAWTTAEGHAAMTGSGAEGEPKVGSPFVAWGGYITGVTKKLEKNKRVVQTWRTMEFPKSAQDSRIDVTFRAHKGGCLVTVTHTKLRKGDGAKYTTGWYGHYIEPMTKYFGAPK